MLTCCSNLLRALDEEASINTKIVQMNLIDKHIIIRSSRAIRCLPLNLNFYNEVKSYGLSAEKVFQNKTVYLSNSSYNFKNKDAIENKFLWLIKIGVLRREVDGQGLTEKVRLTPIGRIILEKEPNLPEQMPTNLELIKNWMDQKILMV